MKAGKFVPLEKSGKDKESKKFGKEGSKKEEAKDNFFLTGGDWECARDDIILIP